MFIKKINKYLSITLLIMLCLGLIGCIERETPDPQPIPIDTRYTDQLKLTTPWEGKNFLTQGIGEARLSQTVDGDTAHFRVDGTNVTVRFLSINTPESTGRIDPWGKAASKFVGDILKSATTIVLEAEEVGKPAQLDTTGRRYLGYVWYRVGENEDLRLLNLEIVEQCYSQFTGVRTDTKYGDIFHDAQAKSYLTKQRVFGQKDPDYDYTNETIELTIAEIKKNFDQYSGGSRLKVSATVMRVNGSNLYLQDIDETFNEETNEYERAAMYLYSGFGSGLSVLKVGTEISFKCQIVENETYGRQLTNPTEVRIIANSDGKEVDIFTIPNAVNSLADYEGHVVRLENVLVKSKTQPNETGAYTFTVQLQNGANINIRVDGATFPKYPFDDVIINERYDVIGGVSKFHEAYQIMLGNRTGFQQNDLIKK